MNGRERANGRKESGFHTLRRLKHAIETGWAARTYQRTVLQAEVRHNMARGTHRVELSAKLVAALKKHNWTNQRIGMELGMDPDEVLRLKQITGLAEAFKDKEFSKSWE